MNPILEALERGAAATPARTVLIGDRGSLTWAELAGLVAAWRERLLALRPGPIALALDNGPAWVVLDLSALAAGIPCIPLPLFFSPQQRRHVLDRVGVVVEAASEAAGPVLSLAGTRICLRRRAAGAGAPKVAKITFTSGTTGAPKGVCLEAAVMAQVARSLIEVIEVTPADRHLAVLPLTTLLENVAGVYAPLLAGACTVVPSLGSVGLSGSSEFDVIAMVRAMRAWRPTTAILLPAMLKALVEAGSSGVAFPDSLRFLAVGGAPVAKCLLQRAAAAGLPVFQGYGLSECASVVAVNGPRGNRPGSVGRPLPHVGVAIAGDGEILVTGSRCRGYLGEAPLPASEPLATGDLGRLDESGYLYVEGRKRDVFITGFGRNVCPAWVESELSAEPAICQAAVFGEGAERNTAVVVAAGDAAAVPAAVAAANGRLPDYARIGRWLAAGAPFTPANGLVGSGGGLRRKAIGLAYGIE